MTLYEKAMAMVEETEKSLRQLMGEAVELGDYATVTQLASLAEHLTQIRGHPPQKQAVLTLSADETKVSQGEDDKKASPSGSQWRQSTNTPAEKYPRFEREGQRLVKKGWSERDRRVYEHRAPWDVVLAVCDALSKRAIRGRRFKMEEILPDVADLKNPVPSYQAYLTLAWLRSEGIVERDGKDGYRLKGGSLTADRVGSLWTSLPERPVQ